MTPAVERTLLFTDLVDSTALASRLGDAGAADVWIAHDRRARDLLERCGGQEIDRADGFFLLFDGANEAARFALAYQALVTELGLRARVGIHVGPVTLRESAASDVSRGAKPIEVDGLAKPFAARVMALAGAGQTLLSATARRALDEHAIGGNVESHGHYRLKGVDEPAEIFEIGAPGCAFTPPADADKAYRVVRTDMLWTPLRQVRHNLPTERDAFVGRSAELHDLARRIGSGSRLVTVLGTGGTGKTRLASRYGRGWLGDWPGGVYFCDLSEARSPADIHFAVATALEVPLGKEDPVAMLGHAIAGRGRCLIVLDNFEQVAAQAPSTLGRWLDRASEAAFLVTSRERLNLAGEDVLPLEPLSLAHEAIELFAVRARAQRGDFALSDANRVAVAEIVRLVDGLPLAIELAAARVKVLSPAQIVARMHDRFGVLTGARGAAARQATLRAAIDWSWDLLPAWEQNALAQCSVFDGGFTLQAAEAVLDLSAWPGAPSALDLVQALADKSLLRIWHAAGQDRYGLEEPYFGMYLSIHEYAAEKLTASSAGARVGAETRHGAYFASFGDEPALDALYLHGSVPLRRTLAHEIANLCAACRRGVARADAPVAVGTYRAACEVFATQGPYALASELGAQVLALRNIPGGLRGAACVTRARAAWLRGDMAEAVPLLDEAVVLAEALGDRSLAGVARFQQGLIHRVQGRNDKAQEHLEHALAIYRGLGHRRLECTALGNLGTLHSEQGHVDLATQHFESALAIAREVGNRSAEGNVLGNLGNLCFGQGRFDDALAHFDLALAVHRDSGNRRAEALVLGNRANLQLQQGRQDEAGESYAAALIAVRELGSRRDESFILGNLGSLRREQGRLGEARDHYDQAIGISREIGHRRFEGCILSSLGDLLFRQGKVEEAGATLASAEKLLREVNDRVELAKLLCTRGRIEASTGANEAAAASLAEAEAAAAALQVELDSDLARQIAKLRMALG